LYQSSGHLIFLLQPCPVFAQQFPGGLPSE
jgi:hypothetical protein